MFLQGNSDGDFKKFDSGGRQNKSKMIMIGSLVCFIIFTMALNFVQSPAVGCLKHNGTHYLLEVPDETINERDYESRGRDREEEDGEDIEPVEVREKRDTGPVVSWIDGFGNSHPVIVRGSSSMGMRRMKRRSNNDDAGRTFTNALSGSLNFEGDFLPADEYVRKYSDLLTDDEDPGNDNNDDLGNVESMRMKREAKKPGVGHVIGTSPLQVEFVVNYKEKDHETWFSPPNSNLVYTSKDVQKVFFLLLLLILIGEGLGAPALTLADRTAQVGKERNYTICFAVFSVLMGCAGITSTQFRFPQTQVPDSLRLDDVNKDGQAGANNVQTEYKFSLEGNPVPDPVQEPVRPAADLGKSKVFAQQLPRQMPEWMTVFRHFASPRCATFLFVAWLMGFGIGLIFTFLFWHLQDFGGTPTLFGIASVINHISEIFAYFFSFRLITQIGHVKVLCLGLIGNVIRFLYISWLRNPWWVLPFEFMQGITHAAVWAACCSYIAHVTPMDLRPHANGVLQGLHHGFGRACGAILGGCFVQYFGSQATFRAYGFFCLLVLVAFVLIHFFREGKFQIDLSHVDDPRVVAEASHLAPHGVPATPMPRVLSSSKIQDLAEQQQQHSQVNYGSGPNLGVGGTSNPFLGGGGGDFSGGYNYHMGITGGTDSGSDVEDVFPSPTASTNPFMDPAFGLTNKGKSLRSPDVMVDLDWIRENFHAYNDALKELVESEEKLLKGPMPKTKPHHQQPLPAYATNEYDW
ncbi:unnamed protein product [Notodromas monacha]|uniref:Major facilitator superfamily associated domain-containing protein n=1 Tax=Notodromas monacha TaxID=399045 RepID=A0A7R9BRP0_9CRUS|nr:unnamed protein product [Notodromas monacha]CAG0919054.1 unnamed protein product [Notodromas monacha]